MTNKYEGKIKEILSGYGVKLPESSPKSSFGELIKELSTTLQESADRQSLEVLNGFIEFIGS